MASHENQKELPQSDLGTPARLVEDVVVDSILGKGAFAIVYKGRQLRLNRTVAVKVVSHNNLSPDSGVDRFQQEAQLTSRLDHPNIAKILSFGTSSKGDPYLVIEYINGITLEEELKDQSKLSLHNFTQIFLPILAALGYAHSQGIVHRDVKPGNIILIKQSDNELTPKLVDFGIAKAFLEPESNQHHTGTGLFVGTPTYMSPEQCNKKNVDGRSDLYSLGCVMYQYLTGSAPFNGASAFEIMGQHIHAERPSVKNFASNAGISNKLAQTILSTLEKDPDNRPASATELSKQLLDGLSTCSSDKSSHQERTKKGGSARSSFWAAGLILAGAGAASAVFNSYAPPETRLVRAAPKSAINGSANTKSLSTELHEIELLKISESPPDREEALSRLISVIPRLEESKKMNRALLAQAYADTAISAASVYYNSKNADAMKLESLRKTVLEFEEKGAKLSLEHNFPESFVFGCLNTFRMLAEPENTPDRLPERVAQANQKWPGSSETAEIALSAFFYLYRAGDLKRAEKIGDLLSASTASAPDTLISVVAVAIKAAVAAERGQKKKALSLLEKVEKEFDSFSSIKAHSRVRVAELLIQGSYAKIKEDARYARFLERELLHHESLYQGEDANTAARMCEITAAAMRAANDPEKAISYDEKSINYYEKLLPEQKTAYFRTKELIQRLHKLGPKYKAKEEQYQSKLESIVKSFKGEPSIEKRLQEP